MPYVIAVTGGIGSGKSSVATIFENLGVAVVDTDRISHHLTSAGQPGARIIADQFGPEFLRADGALDRDRMRTMVFSDAAARKKLEGILHPMIRAEVASAVQRAQSPYVVVIVPLLIETGAYRDLARRVLVVDCSEAQQIVRASRRDGLATEAVQAIMASQATRTERLRHADDIVLNESTLEALAAAVGALHLRYLAFAANSTNDTGKSGISP
jgi:dephospho-CoA kinase